MPRANPIVGTTVYLCSREAYTVPANDSVTITGRFFIEEFVPCDPAAYQHEAGYSIYRVRGGEEFFLPFYVPDYDDPPEGWDDA